MYESKSKIIIDKSIFNYLHIEVCRNLGLIDKHFKKPTKLMSSATGNETVFSLLHFSICPLFFAHARTEVATLMKRLNKQAWVESK